MSKIWFSQGEKLTHFGKMGGTARFLLASKTEAVISETLYQDILITITKDPVKVSKHCQPGLIIFKQQMANKGTREKCVYVCVFVHNITFESQLNQSIVALGFLVFHISNICDV